jgi:hypothetical protein
MTRKKRKIIYLLMAEQIQEGVKNREKMIAEFE